MASTREIWAGLWAKEMESDDDDLPASYLLYIVAVMIAIGVAVISTFFFLIR
jgi:hypothetical protein